jgi:hypothetical protein
MPWSFRAAAKDDEAPARREVGERMNIGEPLRIIEVEPLWIPLPDAAPAPTERPVRGPEREPEPEPAIPER